jgi:glycine cleavage system aminomethyltransferase T
MGNQSIMKNVFMEQNFLFGKDHNNGYEVPLRSPSFEKEYDILRTGIGFTDLSNVLLYRLNGDEVVDFLDYLLSGDVSMLREEHILHTLCLNENGEIITEVYVANNEDSFFVLADGGDFTAFEALVESHKNSYKVEIEKLNDSHALFSVDGPYAWVPVKNVFGSEILGLRYLNFLSSEETGKTVYLFRAGKTGEYGYWILTPREGAEELLNKLREATEGYTTGLYGKDLSALARLENRFLNLNAEGNFTKNPYELGLFWSIQTNKETLASKSISSMINSGIQRSSIGFTSDGKEIHAGDIIYYKEHPIGTVVSRGFCFTRNQEIGLALLLKDYAYTTLTYHAGENRTPVYTVSTPFVVNKSLTTRIE